MRWNPGTKYKNKVIEEKGERFDSQGEFNRWCELKMLEKAGQITDLKRQVHFELVPAQYAIVEGKQRCVERKAEYVADFVYTEGGVTIVEDYKGFETDAFKLKRKLMLWEYGIRIRLTR